MCVWIFFFYKLLNGKVNGNIYISNRKFYECFMKFYEIL